MLESVDKELTGITERCRIQNERLKKSGKSNFSEVKFFEKKS